MAAVVTKRSAAQLYCGSDDHPDVEVNIALIARSDAGWVPIRPENITGSNPKLRGFDRPGNWISTQVLQAGTTAGEVVPQVTPRASAASADPDHMRYEFRCPRCRFTLPVTGPRLDQAMDAVTSRGEWRVTMRLLAAILIRM